jgi:hypothetical protein
MGGRLLERCINIKLRAKLGKSASETLQMLTEAYGADAMKKSSGIKGSKRVGKTTKELDVRKLTGKMKM